MSSHSLSLRQAPVLTGNLVGIVVSVTLHALILLLMMHHWQPEREDRKVQRPRFVEAKLLQMKPAIAEPQKPKPETKPQPKPQPQPQPKPQPKEDPAIKQRAEEQKKQEQQKQEQQRQEQLKREQQVKEQAAQKRKQEEEAAKQKELERQQQIKQDAEKKRQEEIKRQQEVARQAELARALAMEEEMLDAEETDAQVGTYTDYMASLIASNWSRPPSARRDMQVELQISLGSAGRVTGVSVGRSSGNAAFDRSAEQAVWKVGQFSRLQEMDPALYQREFRKLILLFKPEDLRM